MLEMYFRVFLLVLFLNNFKCQQNGNGFYGTVELVKQSPRRSRLLSDFVNPSPEARSSAPHPIHIPLSPSPTPSSQSSSPSAQSEPATSASFPTTISAAPDLPVKPTIDTLRKYGKIFKMDTKYLTPQQRSLLERIVDRVARLGGNLELSDNITSVNRTQANETVDNESEGRARARNNRKKSGKKSNNASKSSESTDESGTEAETSAASSASTVPFTATASSVKAMKRTTAGIIAHPTKTVGASATKVGKSKVTQTHNLTQLKSNSTNMELGNITTTSIVDSLSKDNARENVYNRRPDKTVTTTIPNANQNNNNNSNKTPSIKPTKYHYYPHNQHIYLLPECAIQQVCNAVYVRLNYTQPLCACPARYRDPCSASINEDDLHTTKLIGDQHKKAITLAKTCESTTEMRECRSPRDWSLLALQNTRTGKSHYLVICRCPDNYNLEGPMAHDQPTYASVPGIRVFGMMCVKPIGLPSIGIRRPAYQPPKQYPQQQSPYFQRYKKHATMAPPKTSTASSERTSRQQTDFTEYTTKGTTTTVALNGTSDSGELVTVYDSDDITEERTSTLDATSAAFDSTVTVNASSSEEIEDDDNYTSPLNGHALPHEIESRVKRMIDEISANSRFSRINDENMDDENFVDSFEHEESTIDDDSSSTNSRSRSSRSTDDWPDIPWHEVSEQIKHIQWD